MVTGKGTTEKIFIVPGRNRTQDLRDAGAFIAISLFKHSLFDRKFQLENVTSEKDQRLADKDEEIAAKQEELKQKEQEIQALENEIGESNEYLAEIESTVDEVSLRFSSILVCLCSGKV